jgi:hypothetical protein
VQQWSYEKKETAMNDKAYCCDCDEEIVLTPIKRVSAWRDKSGPLCGECYRDLIADGIIVEDE